MQVLINPMSFQKHAFGLARLCESWYRYGWTDELISLKTLKNASEAEYPVFSSNLRQRTSGETEKKSLVVLGGDGTLHHAVNRIGLAGLAQTDIMVLPAGTGNDFARSLEIPLDPCQAWEVLSGCGKTVQVDVGVITPQGSDREILFLCACSLGFGADVTRFATRPLRNRIGRGAFAWGAMRFLMQRPTPVHRMKLYMNGYKRSISAQQFVVGNSRTHGGGFPISPSAGLQSGLLDIYRVKPMKLWENIFYLGKALMGQDHTTFEDQVRFHRVQDLVIELGQQVDTDIDGEIYHLEAGKVSIKVLPGYLSVRVPDWEQWAQHDAPLHSLGKAV